MLWNVHPQGLRKCAPPINTWVIKDYFFVEQTPNNLAAFCWSIADLLRGDFNKAVDEAIMDSGDAHNNQMMQLLSNPTKAKTFARLVFDLLQQPH